MPRKHHYGATAISNFHDLGVGCQGHLRSNVKVEVESSHVVSYLLVIVTICLGSTIKDLEQFSIYFNAFLMRNDKVSCDLYRGQTDLSFAHHVDLW